MPPNVTACSIATQATRVEMLDSALVNHSLTTPRCHIGTNHIWENREPTFSKDRVVNVGYSQGRSVFQTRDYSTHEKSSKKTLPRGNDFKRSIVWYLCDLIALIDPLFQSYTAKMANRTTPTQQTYSPGTSGIIDKKRIQDLVKEVDPMEQLDEDVEEVGMAY